MDGIHIFLSQQDDISYSENTPLIWFLMIWFIKIKWIQFFKFPRFVYSFKAALGYVNNDNRVEFECNGVIISEQFVLTAAQCAESYRPPVVVRLGPVSIKFIWETFGVIQTTKTLKTKAEIWLNSKRILH